MLKISTESDTDCLKLGTKQQWILYGMSIKKQFYN